MFLLRVLLLLAYTSFSVAEHLSEPNMVYNKSSQLTVDNINKTIEIIRDPTQVIGASMGNVSVKSLKNAIPDLSSLTNRKPQPLRDPTEMSGNFRQALNSYKPKTTTTDSDTESNAVPTIELIGKVFIPVDPLSMDQQYQDRSSVVLNINEKAVHLKEGARSSIVIQEHIVTVSVEEITKQYVKIRLSPSNETLLLY